jgi:predicted phage-related endonuclease
MSSIADVEAVVHKPAAWHEARSGGVGSSDVAKIMAGDWHDLWAQKTGRVQPEDLSSVLPVVLGAFTESLNGWWYQQRMGVELTPCVRQAHPDHPFLIAGGDYSEPGGGVECKHVNAFSKDEEVVSRYWWQCQHQMAVYGWPRVYLSVIFGTQRWDRFEIVRDEDAIAEMIETCGRFWKHVETDTPPENFEGEVVKVSLDDMREVSMDGNNAWSSFAADWLENKLPAKTFETAAKELKTLVEADVKRAYGAGIEIKRSKAGALSIREEK